MDELVSIIVPVYNKKQYIQRCVHSILSQSYTKFEVILIDDGSQDGSGFICDGYALKDDRVRVFHQKNSGVSAARNYGLNKAKGEYIFFVDPDDYIDRNLLLDAVHKMIWDQSDIVLWGIRVIDKHGYTDEYITSILCGNNAFSLMEKISAIRGWEVWRKGYRRALWDQVRFPPDLKTCEDVYVMPEIMMKVCNISILNGIYYFWDRRPHGSLTQTRSAYSYYEEFIAWFHHLNFNHGSKQYKELCFSRTMCSGIKAILKNNRDHSLSKENYFFIIRKFQQWNYSMQLINPSLYYYFNFQKSLITNDIDSEGNNIDLYKSAIKLYSSNLITPLFINQYISEVDNILFNKSFINNKTKLIYKILGWFIRNKCVYFVYLYGFILCFKLSKRINIKLHD